MEFKKLINDALEHLELCGPDLAWEGYLVPTPETSNLCAIKVQNFDLPGISLVPESKVVVDEFSDTNSFIKEIKDYRVHVRLGDISYLESLLESFKLTGQWTLEICPCLDLDYRKEYKIVCSNKEISFLKGSYEINWDSAKVIGKVLL